MPETAVEEMKLREYRQRRRLESLRQQLYAQPDPAQATELSTALTDAERTLKEVQGERLLQEQAANASKANAGVLISTENDLAEKAGGIKLGADTTGMDTKVLLRMARVPTGVVHLLDVKETPLVSFEISNKKDEPLRVRLTSRIEGFSASAVDTVELEPLQSVTIDQLPTFFPDRLAHINEVTRATLNIQIDNLDGKMERQTTFPIWLMARTSAFNSIYDPAKKEWKDISYYYAAWVTPNAPEIMQLLRRAADKHPEKAMAGYQVDKAGVKEQVRAIYNALKGEKIMYIHSVVNFGASDEQNMQRVRLPRESLANRSANCIDGTVLMASVLEAASINPGFTFVPGHAFLAWETEEESNDWDYVETTMMSTHPFEAAHKEGQRQAKAQQAAFETSHDINDYLRYSLAELRAVRGIYPME